MTKSKNLDLKGSMNKLISFAVVWLLKGELNDMIS